MKGYYDIYLRPAGTMFATMPLTSNILDGWDRLDLPDEVTKLSLDGIGKQLGDGTTLWDGEKIEFEAGTLSVPWYEWAYLRSTYHGQRCDVLLMDPLNEEFVAVAFGLTLNLSLVLESGESMVIKVTGSREGSTDATSHVLVSGTAGSAVIRGIIYDAGFTPVEGATVQIVSGGTTLTDTTDYLGEYLILAGAPLTWTFTVTKSGMTFPSGQTLAVIANQQYTKDITATA